MGDEIEVTLYCGWCPSFVSYGTGSKFRARRLATKDGWAIIEIRPGNESRYMCPQCAKDRCMTCQGRGWGYAGDGSPAPVVCPECRGSGKRK